MMPSDRPSDDLLEDDVALDRWFEAYVRDASRKAGKRTGDPRLSFTGREGNQIPEFHGRAP